MMWLTDVITLKSMFKSTHLWMLIDPSVCMTDNQKNTKILCYDKFFYLWHTFFPKASDRENRREIFAIYHSLKLSYQPDSNAESCYARDIHGESSWQLLFRLLVRLCLAFAHNGCQTCYSDVLQCDQILIVKK